MCFVILKVSNKIQNILHYKKFQIIKKFGLSCSGVDRYSLVSIRVKQIYVDLYSIYLSCIQYLLGVGGLVDLDIICLDEIKIKAHKVVMAAASSFFKVCF